ncbi:hypothetical protein KJ652_03720 [Patescibacteria group bacterium]|nr:hypothetical protein [Patescibacteria group bacterium]
MNQDPNTHEGYEFTDASHGQMPRNTDGLETAAHQLIASLDQDSKDLRADESEEDYGGASFYIGILGHETQQDILRLENRSSENEITLNAATSRMARRLAHLAGTAESHSGSDKNEASKRSALFEQLAPLAFPKVKTIKNPSHSIGRICNSEVMDELGLPSLPDYHSLQLMYQGNPQELLKIVRQVVQQMSYRVDDRFYTLWLADRNPELLEEPDKGLVGNTKEQSAKYIKWTENLYKMRLIEEQLKQRAAEKGDADAADIIRNSL